MGSTYSAGPRRSRGSQRHQADGGRHTSRCTPVRVPALDSNTRVATPVDSTSTYLLSLGLWWWFSSNSAEVGGADDQVARSLLRTSLNATPMSTAGSLGRPSTRSPMMLRWISSVPPAIDAAGTETIVSATI